MYILLLGLIIFLIIHAVPINQSLKNNMNKSLGVTGYRIVFSIFSIIGLVLIIYGYSVARDNPLDIDPIYTPPGFLKPVMLLMMIPVFILIIEAYLPGKIKLFLKHPFFIAIKIWAIAHLLVNGNAADIILFASFLAWAVIGMISAKKRERLDTNTTIVSGKFSNDIIAIVFGIGLYIIFVIWLHEKLIGISPIVVS